MKHLSCAILLLACPIAHGESPSDEALIEAEVHDKKVRQQAELLDRIRDLEAQQESSKAIAKKQQQLIDALEAQIKALQERERERSDREE